MKTQIKKCPFLSKRKISIILKNLKVKNQTAILHAQFGRPDKAQDVLEQCIKENKNFIPAYLNLANIFFMEEKFNSAIDTLEDGLKIKSNSPYLNLLMARCYYSKGNIRKSKNYFAVVTDSSPELASKYSYIIQEDSQNRAGIFDDPLIWDIGE